MVQPINYTSFLQDQGVSQGIANIAQQLQQRKQKALAEEQSKAYRADLEAAFKAGTPQAFSELIAKYPQQREAFKDSWDILNQGQKDSEFKEAAQVYSALENNPEIAAQIVDRRIAALENAGQDATKIKQIRELMKTNPSAVKNQLAFTLSTVDPDKWGKIATEMRSRSMAPLDLKKAAADLNLTNAQTAKALAGTRKLNADIRKTILEMEAAKESDSGLIEDPEKRFGLEQKLRGEYSKETKNFDTVQESFRRLDAAQDTAAGDLSLIFNYMKMLDPGSTVREGEFATAQNAAGVGDRVMNIYNNLRTGQRLNPKQRAEFKSQAASLFNASLTKEKDVRKGLERVVNNYRLDPNNVFLIDQPQEVSTTTTREEVEAGADLPTSEELQEFRAKFLGQ